ncbi:MAG: RidA family protein [Hyphomicrobiales bacterium]|jgi:2-iminobutanoate/2-iminopropanoate deaminase|nr:RidA family protein [Hyphomicrobiales bacterium]
MRETIETGLPQHSQPFAWATRAGGFIFTTHGPVQSDGTILQAPIEQQARLTLDNLKTALANAGASLDDVAQVQIFLIDAADMAPVDRVYREYFQAPYPTRASLVVAGLVAPGMRIELCAVAHAPGVTD